MIVKEGTEILKNTVVESILERKGHDIKVLNIKKLEQSVADYFVICHATSTTQVDAIADFIEGQTRELLKEKPQHKEGKENSHWVLLDYADVVVHIFLEEYRPFYNLEDLWADADIETIKQD